MANEINQDIYVNKYEYSYGGKPLFTTTDLLTNLMKEGWQKNTLMESSNVYTTFQSNQFPNLCGATTTEFELDYTDNTGQPSQEGVQKIITTKNIPTNINLRYIYHEQDFGNNGESFGLRWTGFTDDQYQNLINMLDGISSISYKDYNIKSSFYGGEPIDTTTAFPGTQYGAGSTKQQFITSINRENLFYRVVPTFAYINSNNQLVNVQPSFEEYKDWLENDESGFINLNGQNCFLIGINRQLLVNDGNQFIATGRIQKKDLDTDTTTDVSNSFTSVLGEGINLFCENYHNDSLYYYTLPMCNVNDAGIQVVYYRATFGRYNFTMPSLNGSTSNYTYHGIDAFSYSIEQEPQFNQGFMTIPIEEIELDLQNDEFFSVKPGINQRKCKLYGRNLMTAVALDGNSYRPAVLFERYCISGKELMANLALSLIPFAFSTITDMTINQNTNPDAMFVGIRNDNGTVSGDYIPYVWGETEVEKDFRPEDFVPEDPTKEPETPDQPDEGDIGENPNANNYGDSIGFNSDGSLPLEGLDSTKTYVLNKATLNEMFANLWNSPESFWDALSMNGSNSANVFDYLINIKAYPFSIPAHSATKTIYLGAGAELTVNATSGFYTPNAIVQELSFGGVTITSDFAKSFLGKQPYSKLFVHLPYSGTWEIDPKFASGTYAEGIASILTKGFLDIRTGTLVYVVYRYDSSVDTQTPLLIKTTNVGTDIPISGADLTTQSSNIINATLSTARTVTNVASNAFTTLAKAGTGNYGGALLDAVEATGNVIGSVANLAAASREIPQLSGGTTGASAPIADSYCYFILQEPIVANPKNFNHTYGRMCNLQLNIGSQCNGRGFTQCSNVDCSNITGASEQEKAEIKRLMEAGIYC